MTFTKVLEKYRSISFSERNKGERFERLMQAFLQTYPVYRGRFAHVWLWKDFPHKDDLGGRDTGIDLVARTVDGEYWAVQCKCYDEKSAIDKPAVDSFLATSSRTFVNDQGQTTAFSLRLWISTTNKWGSGAEDAIRNQNPPVHRINLAALQNCSVDWDALDNGIYGEKARLPQKTPRDHQQKAIDAFHEHFKTETRGKLIMACGTGKTFTSLKIAERETGGKGIVLFLAPSIALVGQTLREWMAETGVQISPVCICSDPEVSRSKKKRDDDLDGETIVDLALPASTNAEVITEQIKTNREFAPDSLLVIFSTYQSIETVHKVQKELGGTEIDLVICDEAHRTTGVTLKGDEDSAFVRVHDDEFIRAKKRVYMTATPRLYAEDSKKKAKDCEAYLCSMDDKAMYGEEVFHIGFGEAVDKGLLADYKVLILTLNESDIPASLQEAVADKDQEINVDDISKLMGCIKALSKNMRTDEGLLKASDPSPMHKAVAFCSSIKASKHICEIFNNFKDSYFASLSDVEKEELVSVAADHVDGSMGAGIRESKLSWLNDTPSDGRDCRILSNVRCLSEGVDVPSLDAVLFLSARNSQVDVVQSVGRVMRTAPGKKFGYIIIPLLIPASVRPEEALNDNKRFAVVWSVLNALRAHDDRFSALVNRISLHEKNDRIIVDTVGNGGSVDGGDTPFPKPDTSPKTLPGLSRYFYARMVQKVGDKRYWEQWAADIAEIVQRYMERITRLIAVPGPHKDAFEEFLGGLQKNINPSVTQDEVVVMLAQHMITKPVFEALFENYSFVQNNPVSKSMQSMVDLLEEQALEKDAIVLSRFYESVRMRVSGITTTEGRQRTITELYDKFFRIAFPQTVEKLGIVYTPVEVVDFINRSVADILQATFGCTLSDKNVHVLDPFTGTGTFIARMISSGLIEKDALPYKYEHELHANEIVLLAYYIASINIENVFHDTQGEEAGYRPFNGICLTDTFQLGETEDNGYLVTPKMQQNSDRVKAQKELPIQIIIGNPPYSVGQKSANDNAQNQSYPVLEGRISKTYASLTTATLKNSLYDSYIKAFRWASDRLPKDQPGIIGFVTNAGWLDGNAQNGFRKCLEEEFSAIYVFNLRGNQRTSGELSRREGGKIFGSGSRTPIAITILVRNPEHEGRALIKYCDIGDYLSREEKLEILVKKRSALSSTMQWQDIHPDANGDWLNQRNDVFASFIPLGDKEDKKNTHTFFMPLYTRGVATGRDAWCWNYSKELLTENITSTIKFYNSEVTRLATLSPLANNGGDRINRDAKKFSWARQQIKDVLAQRNYSFSKESVYTGLYRPFQKASIYFNRQMNDMVYKLPSLFPTNRAENILICISGLSGTKQNTAIIVNSIPDLNLLDAGTQCFPLYYYKEKSAYTPTLMDSLNTSGDNFERKDAITDFILERCRGQYGPKVTKEDIFYYVYGLLHSPDYRTVFAADLKKMLPRLPLVEKPDDFRAFSRAGRELAALHLSYEDLPACAEVMVEGAEHGSFHVEKMRFPDKNDKSVIEYNSSITLKHIPLEAYEYVINGRSAIEWIMERYQVRQDKASGIVNDPNDWAREQGKPRYILDLLLSVITVSLETMKIVSGLPRLSFDNV